MAQHQIRNGKVTLDVEVDDFSAPWRRDKTPMLLQHGYGRSAGIWTTWMPHVSAHYPTIRPTLRGLRRKIDGFDPASDISMDAYLSDLCRILDELKIEKIHYCGESFGGCIGIAFAARYPERVKSLSIVASPVFFNPKWQENYSLGYGSWAEAMEAMGVEAWLAKTNGSTRFPPSLGEDFLDWYNEQLLGADQQVLIAMARMIAQADIRSCLNDIKAPLLLLRPMGGGIMTDEQVAEYTARVKNLTVLSFHTTFHKIQLLHARECALHVSYFCSHVEGTALLGM